MADFYEWNADRRQWHDNNNKRQLAKSLQAIAATKDNTKGADVAVMVWELYRDKVLTSFQTKEILVCLGFTVVYDSKNEHLVSFR